jgi:hypothetical protein
MIKVNLGAYCDLTCASEYGRAEATKKKQKAARKQHREDKERIKPASQYMKEAQAAINAFVRVKDHGKPCISCGSITDDSDLLTGSRKDAGHYRSRGAAGHLRFNLYNIHGQCVKCNRYNSGNAVDYRINLIKKIGLDKVERLEHDNKPKSFDIEYLKRIKTIFNKRTRIYKKIKAL